MFLLICFSCTLWIIGVYGMMLPRRHVIIVSVSLEIMLLAVNIILIVSSVYMDDFIGQLYASPVPTAAAAEIAIGLAICIAYYRLRGGISLDYVNLSKG